MVTRDTKVWVKSTGSQWDNSNPIVMCQLSIPNVTPVQVFNAVTQSYIILQYMDRD